VNADVQKAADTGPEQGGKAGGKKLVKEKV
jgi:hypothetical protein